MSMEERNTASKPLTSADPPDDSPPMEGTPLQILVTSSIPAQQLRPPPSSVRHAHTDGDDGDDGDPSPPSTIPSSSSAASTISQPDGSNGVTTTTNCSNSATASSNVIPAATAMVPPASEVDSNIAAVVIAVTTQPPPAPQALAVPQQTTLQAATAGQPLLPLPPPVALIQQPPLYQTAAGSKSKRGNGASVTSGADEEGNRWCCGRNFDRSKWVGTISCTLAPWSCYSQGSGVLGNAACCLVWPVTTIAGLVWGAAHSVTRKCCGYCG